MLLSAEIEARYWRVEISDPGNSTEARIGVIYIGKALAMQRKIYGGHSPVTLSRVNETIPVRSDSGQWLGRTSIRKGVATDYAWQNLTASWYREYFDPFVKAAIDQAFFIAWYPEKYPDEVGYGWTGDIKPENQGIRNYLTVSFSFQGNSDD